MEKTIVCKLMDLVTGRALMAIEDDPQTAPQTAAEHMSPMAIEDSTRSMCTDLETDAESWDELAAWASAMPTCAWVSPVTTAPRCILDVPTPTAEEALAAAMRSKPLPLGRTSNLPCASALATTKFSPRKEFTHARLHPHMHSAHPMCIPANSTGHHAITKRFKNLVVASKEATKAAREEDHIPGFSKGRLDAHAARFN
jgi:hypothetical protein